MKISSKRNAIASALALTGLFMFGGAAQAGQVTASWNGGIGTFQNLTYSIPGKSSTTSAGLFEFNQTAGPNLLPADNTFVAFCVDLQEFIGASVSHVWDIKSLSEVPTPAGPPNPANGMGQPKADALAALFGTHLGTSLAAAKTLDQDRRAAMQIAVWEIVYETNTTAPYAIDTGNATFTPSATIKGYANAYLSNLDDSKAMKNLVGLANEDNIGGANYTQDMVAQVVPIPAAAWLFGSAILGVVALGRRKQKEGAEA